MKAVPLRTIALGLLLFAGCFSPNPVRLTYEPSGVPAKTPSNIELGAVTDSRDLTAKDPTYFGEIRSGWGTHMKSLRTQGTVADEVREAFDQGLRARGKIGLGRHRLDVQILRFSCNQYVRREAHADFSYTLTSIETGKVEYTNRAAVNKVQGSAFALDVAAFASVEDLRAVANEALQEAVDDVLDDPGLRSHLL